MLLPGSCLSLASAGARGWPARSRWWGWARSWGRAAPRSGWGWWVGSPGPGPGRSSDTLKHGGVRSRGKSVTRVILTVLEHPLHVEAVGGARLVVRAALEVARQLPCARILDYPRVAVVDGV